MVARSTGGSKPADDGDEETATGDNATAEVTDYEQIRDQRIKANKERMQKLGLFDLAQKLKSKPSAASKPRRGRLPKDPSDQTNPKPPLSPARRSSRLKTMAPVSYVEIRPKGKRESTWNSEINIKEGKRPEIYTDEDERLLGDCKETWELSVDGYGEDRKRIYDPVKGETCHQCRQKTLGQHTHCCKCNLVQGQFCGDCLYMRYGENVIEANKNPDWVCPVCRGICNCSLCRKEKGWEPTGNLYRKVINLGYKSVAHYLIQTRRSQPKSETSGAEESVQDDMKQETEDGQVAGEKEMEEVQPVAAKDMGNIHDTGSGVAGDSVEGETKEKSRRRSTRLRKT
ncbi:PREDICTED: cell division cycle-associated protein 7-like [Fragaria vesca subsp. vesca]|uniref:cell division cycle-associated protein 7-like n=1 Tax=Fragaria vesca subsp. vesca TaxID=101020 RepID=UPI0002C35E43|nr:PREDICTED: cell division cycle-associated protein 7-like [Fragaria vesca subsp. vesca]